MSFSTYEHSSEQRLEEVVDQFGVVTWRQMAEAGIGGRHVRRLIGNGQLLPAARGVYRTPAPNEVQGAWRQRARVALLAAGHGAVLARSSGGVLWDLDGFRLRSGGRVSAWDRAGDPRSWPIELNIAVAGTRRGPGRRRAVPLEAPDCIDRLAVTGIGQTLVELGATESPAGLEVTDRVELALESALRRPLTTLSEIAELADTAASHHGSATLRRVLARRPTGAAPTESYLETRTVQLLRRKGFADPERQVELFDRHGRIGRFDFLLAAGGIPRSRHGAMVLEVDGRATHDNDPSFVIDRLRWDRLTALGLRPMVLTYGLVEDEPDLVTTLLRDTLALSG
ncbi:MAG: type IV toxin-antitoxin system AbiEi family antitoxin domain-containing protein [Acidimicrobiales bacterium]